MDSRHRAHLIALSDTIATLQREKCGLELEMVRLKGREEQLQGMVRLCQEEVKGRGLAFAHTFTRECVYLPTYTHSNTHTLVNGHLV